MKVRDVMTPDPQTIAPTATLAAARERMDRGGFRHLPVVDERRHVVGIVTDRDLREHAGHLGDTRITGAMVEPPIAVGVDEPLDAVGNLLLQRRVGGFPVIDGNGCLVGIITETDVLRALLREARGRADA
jgi:acetoin utilization protein AcuB